MLLERLFLMAVSQRFDVVAVGAVNFMKFFYNLF
jgi:hypothetical protein